MLATDLVTGHWRAKWHLLMLNISTSNLANEFDQQLTSVVFMSLLTVRTTLALFPKTCVTKYWANILLNSVWWTWADMHHSNIETYFHYLVRLDQMHFQSAIVYKCLTTSILCTFNVNFSTRKLFFRRNNHNVVCWHILIFSPSARRSQAPNMIMISKYPALLYQWEGVISPFKDLPRYLMRSSTILSCKTNRTISEI